MRASQNKETKKEPGRGAVWPCSDQLPAQATSIGKFNQIFRRFNHEKIPEGKSPNWHALANCLPPPPMISCEGILNQSNVNSERHPHPDGLKWVQPPIGSGHSHWSRRTCALAGPSSFAFGQPV